MRIGFEAKRATHNNRGLGNYSRGVIEGLLNHVPDIELFLYTPPVQNPIGVEWIKTLPANAHIKTPNSLFEKKVSSFWRSFLMANDLKKENLDIFHGLSHEIPYRLDKLSFKKIVTMHDLIFMRYPDFFPLIDRLVYAQKFKYACKHSDKVIAICEQTRDDLVNYLGVDEKKIVVHYQSCSENFYDKQSSEKIQKIKVKYNLDKPFILNVGAFEERKNQLMLLEAFSCVAHKIQEDLVFVGQGKKYKEQIENRIDELKLKSRVHLLSSVTYEDLPSLYQGASVFCFPSLFEGFGIPIIESLFSRTPVITSFGSCFPESAGPDSIFIDPHSISSIGESLVSVLGDQNKQELMRNRGFDYVQRFHIKNTTAKLMDIYSQLTVN